MNIDGKLKFAGHLILDTFKVLALECRTMQNVPAHPLKEIQTRFIFPFFFRERAVTEAAKALEAAQFDHTNRQVPLKLWECSQPTALYRDEVLEHVDRFLFSGDRSVCTYEKMPSETLNAIFGHGVQLLLDQRCLAFLKPVNRVGIEVFITTFGVGILSIALAGEDLTLSEAIDVNYSLARIERMPAAKLHLPHPSEDPQRWANIPAIERSRIAKAPDEKAALAERLGPGGSFTLPEFVEYLLKPLKGLELKRVQSGLSAFVVARFGEEVDFDSAPIRKDLGRFLSALAQIEEVNHAGAIADNLGVANTVLNARHWAAVGLLGAAHLVADQPWPSGPHPFNEQRLPRVRDKYFVPYLMALFQRAFLDRTIRTAGELAGLKRLQPGVISTEGVKAEIATGYGIADAQRGFPELRETILEFAVQGHFVQVSSREALHRFYTIAQEGLRVPEAWREVNFAITNLDKKFSAEQERRLAHDMAQNLVSISRVQQAVHVIEYVVVGTYVAEVWHLFAAEHLKDKGHGWVLSATVLLAFALGALFVKLVNHHFERKKRTDP